MPFASFSRKALTFSTVLLYAQTFKFFRSDRSSDSSFDFLPCNPCRSCLELDSGPIFGMFRWFLV